MSEEDEEIKSWILFLKSWRTGPEIEAEGIDRSVLEKKGYEFEEKEDTATKISRYRRRSPLTVARYHFDRDELTHIWNVLIALKVPEGEEVDKILELIELAKKKGVNYDIPPRRRINYRRLPVKFARQYKRRGVKESYIIRDFRAVFRIGRIGRGFPSRSEIEEIIWVEGAPEIKIITRWRIKVLIAQFLAVVCMKYPAQEGIESRAILDLRFEDYEYDQDKWTVVAEDALKEYLELLGYSEILYDQKTEFTFGFTKPLELKNYTQDDAPAYFLSRWEVVDYRKQRLAHKHKFILTINWWKEKDDTTPIIEQLQARVSLVTTAYGMFDTRKIAKEQTHIWEEKGCPVPTSIIVDGVARKYDPNTQIICSAEELETDGGVSSSTMSDIVSEIIPNQQNGLDVDSYVSEFNRLKSYFNMRYIPDSVDVFESPGGAGLHFETPLPTSWNCRLNNRDCAGRLRCSEIRSSGFYPFIDDVLFVAKRKYRTKLAHRTPIPEDTLLNLPFASRIPRTARKHRGIKHG